jgi:hypothetical protein
MNEVIWILVLVVFLFGGTLGVLVMVVVGIRSTDRALNLTGAPRTRAEALSRRMLGVGVMNPAPGPDDAEEKQR